MRPDVFDTPEPDAVIRIDVDHRSLHRVMWVAFGDRWCDYSFCRRIAGHRPRFGEAAFGSPFSFQLSHGPMLHSVGCPVFRVDGCLFHGALPPSGTMGRKRVSDLLRKGHKLVFDLRIDCIPEQLCLGANDGFASIMAICDKPIKHCPFDISLSLRLQITVVELSSDRGP